MEEGTNYCITNWCTTQETSIFTYDEGEDHSTYALCDEVYVAPVLPDPIPPAILEVNGRVSDMGTQPWRRYTRGQYSATLLLAMLSATTRHRKQLHELFCYVWWRLVEDQELSCAILA